MIAPCPPSLQDVQQDFASMLPELASRLAWRFRYRDGEAQADLVAEAIAIGWDTYRSARLRDRSPSPGNIAFFAGRSVAAVKHKAGGSAMMLCKGIGLRAGSKPMSSYSRRPGETMGHHWYIPSVRQTAEFPHVASDVNYWKTTVHNALFTAAGEPGSLTIFGQGRDHELFAQHVAASETWTTTQGHGRTVHEWTQLPSKPDNHWLDCLAGCAVAASMEGILLPGHEQPARRARKKYTQADLIRR
jgi:hypothetical protein